MSDQDHASILAVGLGGNLQTAVPPEYAENFSVADSAKSAIELLRMLRFDLVVTADQLPDLPVWQFVQRMRSAWPWQKWVLASSSIDQRDEITARTLGVLCVLETPVDWHAVAEMASAIHSRAARSVASIQGMPIPSAVGAGAQMPARSAATTGTLLRP